MRDGWEARTAWLGLVLGAFVGVAIGVIGEQASARAVGDEVEVLGRVQSRDPHIRVVTDVCGARRWGSGAVLDDGTLLTNRHVVEGGSRVTVLIGDREVIPLEVGAASGLDVARLVMPPGSLQEWEPTEVGVMTAGEQIRLSTAYGSADATVVGPRAGVSPGDPPVAWELDAPAPAGMSGGAVLDAEGRLVGMVYAAALQDAAALVIPAADAAAAATTPLGQSRC